MTAGDSAARWEYGLRRADGHVETVIGGGAIKDEADARSVIAAEQRRTDGFAPITFTVVRRKISAWEPVVDQPADADDPRYQDRAWEGTA